jgi:HAD superfamily hydrolase (TIGR01509 family)
MRPALLFDIDGTLADTDPLHLQAFNEVLAPHGITLDHARYKREVMGFSNDLIMQRLLPHDPAAHDGLVEAKEARFRQLAAAGVPATPGLFALLALAGKAGIPCAAVTNAPRANAKLILGGLGLADRFPVLVIGPELARGKPDPLPYLVGAEQLGADIGRSIAFEDSRSGLRSAVAAGLFTVAILSSLTAEEAAAEGAHLTVKDFNDAALSPALADRLFDGDRSAI